MKRALWGGTVAAWLLASPAHADVKPEELHGWWRATVTHAGQSQEIYLLFEERNGKPFSRFSIPWIAADASPLGPYTIEGDKLALPAAGWSFTLNRDGTGFEGVIPADIIPAYQMRARFERSAAPIQPKVDPAGEPPMPLWHAKVDGAVFAPLARDGSSRTVIVGSESGTATALDELTGKVRWSAKLQSPIRAAATVAEDGIYVATDEGVSKLGKAEGRTIWSRDFTGTITTPRTMSDPASRWDHYSSSVVLFDGLAVVGSRDGCVYTLNQHDGAVRQRICSKDSIASTPVVTGGRVYFTSFDHKLYAAELNTGAISWTHDLRAAAPGDLTLVDGRIVAGSRTYDLTAHDPATGEVEWTNYFWFSWIDSAPVADRGQLFVGSSDGLRIFAIDPATGRTGWSTFLGGWAWARPAFDARNVYAGAVGNPNLPYIGPRIGGLAAADRATGRLKWIFRPPHDRGAAISGFASGPLAANGRVFAADLEGNVYALPAD